MTLIKKFTLIFCILTLALNAWSLSADTSRIEIKVIDERAIFKLKLHQSYIQQVFENAKSAQDLFKQTLAGVNVQLNQESCEWRATEVTLVSDINDFSELTAVSVCQLARVKNDTLQFQIDFLKKLPSAHQLMLIVSMDQKPQQHYILTPQQNILQIQEQKSRALLFFKMGWGHIAALPEALLHIVFIFTLVLVSTTMVDLYKNFLGFTLGHVFIILASTLGLVHVHSHWVEALTALSITLLALSSIRQKPLQYGVLFNAGLGTVHGFGFSNVIHDMQLSDEVFWMALLNFILGIEMGQIFCVLMAVAILYGLRQMKNTKEEKVRKVISYFFLLISFYWFIDKALAG